MRGSQSHKEQMKEAGGRREPRAQNVQPDGRGCQQEPSNTRLHPNTHTTSARRWLCSPFHGLDKRVWMGFSHPRGSRAVQLSQDHVQLVSHGPYRLPGTAASGCTSCRSCESELCGVQSSARLW